MEIAVDNTQFLLLVISFFIISILYSSVGFGGGSSYLAMLALTAISFTSIRTTALLCNIIVVTAGTYIFYKEGHLQFRKAWPLVLLSVPFAYIGGLWPIQQQTFFILLSSILILVSFVLWFQPSQKKSGKRTAYHSQGFLAIVGGMLGFLSGLVGIGGGIFLSPLLHIIQWDDAKKISAMASFFILVNSISGLVGQLQQHSAIQWNIVLPLLLAVFIGGQIGSRLGAKTFNAIYVKRITALLVLVAGTKILVDTI